MTEFKIAIAQTHIERDITTNTQVMLDMLGQCEPCDILLFPEGMLSGYFPEDENFLSTLTQEILDDSIQQIGEVSAVRGIDVLFGTAYPMAGKWHNMALWLHGTQRHTLYSKCNLAKLDRNFFEPGATLAPINWHDIPVGIQLCREIRYVEQWLYLKLQGAQVIFHLNNNQSGFFDWEFLLQARASENQYFIVSVNPSHPDQQLFSYVLDTNGHFLLKTNEPGLYYQTLDLTQTNTANIDQRRTDLLQLIDASSKRI